MMKNFLPPVGGRSLLSKLLITGSAMGLALTAASPAMAATVFVDYTGTVSSGFDVSGLFGAAGANLAGKSFTTHYLFDTSLGIRLTSSTYDYTYGGTNYAKASPSLGALLTIGGRSVQVAGDQFGYDFATTGERLATAQSNTGTSLTNDVYHGPAFQPSLDAAFSTTVTDASKNDGSYTNNYGTSLRFVNTTVSGGPVVGITAAVPEPATWAIMLVGFGGIGFAMRRRKVRTTVSYA